MSWSVGDDGVAHDLATGERIGVVEPGFGTVLDADRDDEATMHEPVADVLTRVADANRNIGLLLVEVLNDHRGDEAAKLREIGQHLGSLSAECLGRAAELDGRCIERPERVMIDADCP